MLAIPLDMIKYTIRYDVGELTGTEKMKNGST